MAAEEFLKKMTGYKSKKKTPAKPTNQPVEFDLPESVDWRKAGAVTPVKNQQQCGSCYAFAATGSLEGQQKIKKGKLVSLSEQNIVDCSGPEGNLGCEGGNMDFSYRYIAENGGIDTEKSYPYEAIDGTCRYKKNGLGATAKGYADIPPTEDHLKMAVALVGPISCGIDAGHDSFQLYQGGIYNEPNCSSENLDHAVTVIGYGSENGQDYWLCKNSWGTSWGENGFIKMSRNKGNQCGIATEASYPLV
ncbi:procathepsin L [Caerostris extrusa]|uniref:Procathepsin L n=1 Tax=Caerostris extrusa TaxID=172846 RepID=A0AAV4MB72_CAEEX|nr:procathepsin L [Caerostris extrusa]